MRRRAVLGAGAATCLSACSHPFDFQPVYGLIVDYDILPGAAEKRGVTAVSERGRILFSPGTLLPRTATGAGHTRGSGGMNSYVGPLPKWVRVTWRAGNIDMDFKHGGWIGGSIVGDYRVDVASRIPPEVLDYSTSGRGRALRLSFWVANDGVLLAWDVREPPDSTLPDYVMHGGDFVEPRVYNGKLVAPGWYLKPGGQKVMVE